MINIIMVVDDDPGVVYTIKHGLEKLDPNYKIITANSGKQCLELLKNNEIPDLVLLDIMMPEMTGWTTFKKIREIHSSDQLPVVFLTARKDQVAKDAGGFLGEDYIEKPVKIDELKHRIEKIINKK
jgi:CheY-like chemotaxis protein